MNVTTTNAVVTTHTHTMQGNMARCDVEIVSLLKSCERAINSRYRSGAVPHCVKYPKTPAVKLEAEEWGKHKASSHKKCPRSRPNVRSGKACFGPPW